MPIFRDERQRRRDLERREPAELLGRVSDEFPVEPEHVPRGGELEEHRAAVDRVDRMEAELKRRDHAEVAAPAAERPEQVLVLPFTHREDATVSRHNLGRLEVVDREAGAAREVADPAAEGQPEPTIEIELAGDVVHPGSDT